MIVDDLRKSILDYLLYGKFITSNLSKIKKNLDITSSEFPSNWKLVQIGSVIDIARGGSPRPIKSFLTTAEDGVNWIKIGDTIKGSKYIDSCKEKIIKDGISKSRFVHKGDFLLSNSMSFGRPYILNIDGCIHDGWLVLTDKNELFLKDYLFYVLSSELVYKQFSDMASGAVVSNLNTDKVRETIIPLPPLEEQQRIVDKIECLFAKLDEIKPIEEELLKLKNTFPKDLKNSLYQAAMTGELSIQNDYESARDFLNKLEIVQKETGFVKMKNITPVLESTIPYKIPDNWIWKKIGDLVEINLGFTYRPTYVDKGYMFLSVKDISSGYIDFENVKYISKEEYDKASYGSKPKKGDILFGRVGTIGVPQIVETDDPFCIFVSLGFFRDYTNMLNKKFICYWMCSSLFKKQVADNVTGTAQINLNSNWLKNFYIPIPPIEEQERIVDKLERLLPLCEDIELLEQ